MAWREVRRNLARNSNFTFSVDGYSFVSAANTGTQGDLTHETSRGINDSASGRVRVAKAGDRVHTAPFRLGHDESFTASINLTWWNDAADGKRVRLSAVADGGVLASSGVVTLPGTVSVQRPSVTFMTPKTGGRTVSTRIVVEFLDAPSSSGSRYVVNIDDLLLERTRTLASYFDGDINTGGYEPPEFRTRWVGTPDGLQSVIEQRHSPRPRPGSGYLVFGSFLTGKIVARSNLITGLSADIALNEPDILGFAARLPWFDPVSGTRIDVPNVAIPMRDFIAYVENDEVILGGPVTVDDHSFPAHSVTAKGAWEYFNRRVVLPPLRDGQTPSDVLTRWTDLTISSIGKKLIEQATAWEGGEVPVDFPPSDQQGGHERTYPGEDRTPVGTALTNLTNVVDGADFMFRPKWGADKTHIRWELISGTPLTPSGEWHYWDLSGPDPWATPVSFRRSGEELAVNAFVAGADYQNMLSNPSFIEWEGSTPADWEATGLTVSTNTSNPFDGGQSLTLVVPGLTGRIRQEMPVRILPGARYSGQAWVRDRSNRPPTRVVVEWWDADGASLGSTYGPYVEPATGTGWTPLHVTAVAPSNASEATFVVQVTDTMSGGAIDLGAAMLVEGGTSFLKYVRDMGVIEAWAHNPALLNAGYPTLDLVEDHGTVTRSDTAAAHASEAAIRGSYQLETFTMAVRRDVVPALGSVWPGDFARVNFGDNHRVSKGQHNFRVLRMSFSAAGDVEIEFAPERALGGYSIPASNKAWLARNLRTMSSRIRESESIGLKAY